MCNFKSAVVRPDGSIFHSPWTDHHNELVQMAGIQEDRTFGEPNCVKVEYTVGYGGSDLNPEDYRLMQDQDWTPEWWDDDMQEDVKRRMAAWLRNTLIVGRRVERLYGGVYLLGSGAEVGVAKGCHFIRIGENAHVERMEYCYVRQLTGHSRIGDCSHSSVMSALDWAVIASADYSHISELTGNAQVHSMEDSSVDRMKDDALVGRMTGFSSVLAMVAGSTVLVMEGRSRIGCMRGSARVGLMLENALIDDMRSDAQAPRPPLEDNRDFLCSDRFSDPLARDLSELFASRVTTYQPTGADSAADQMEKTAHRNRATTALNILNDARNDEDSEIFAGAIERNPTWTSPTFPNASTESGIDRGEDVLEEPDNNEEK